MREQAGRLQPRGEVLSGEVLPTGERERSNLLEEGIE
jgi:hypothetical protein